MEEEEVELKRTTNERVIRIGRAVWRRQWYYRFACSDVTVNFSESAIRYITQMERRNNYSLPYFILSLSLFQPFARFGFGRVYLQFEIHWCGETHNQNSRRYWHSNIAHLYNSRSEFNWKRQYSFFFIHRVHNIKFRSLRTEGERELRKTEIKKSARHPSYICNKR